MKTVNRMALFSALTLAGCTADYVQNGNAPVQLYIVALSPNPLSSLVPPGCGVADFADVVVANRGKNPNIDTPIVAQAIIVNRYEVSYYRSDGRGTQGVDIPYSISGAITQAVDVTTSSNTTITIEIVRRQAKMEAPLLQLAGNNGGQALVVTMFAKITLYGQTVAGQTTSASGSMQVDFAGGGTCGS